MKKPHFIIDFDSTFTKVEGLDILAEIALKDKPDRKERVRKIKEITSMGMDGKIEFKQSLIDRLNLLQANRSHLLPLVKRLQKKISISFQRNEAFFQEFGKQILIISSGFKEFIQPIVEPFGIPVRNIYANEFTYDEQGNITGYVKDKLLATNNGKVKQIKALKLRGPVYVIGDGYTDYEIRESGLADKFYAFTENISRDTVAEKADHIIPSLDEFLYKHDLPMAISYPKNRIKALVLDNIHPDAVRNFKEEGYSVQMVSKHLAEDELIELVKDISILCTRTKTNINKKILTAAKKLHCIGAFSKGVSQIDLDFATQKGIPVFNAPYSNAQSLVELAIAEIIMLMRRIPTRMKEMSEGKWKKSTSKSNEIRGKVLGIIGYGNIGSQLSVIAESIGMKVVFYDTLDIMPMGNARKVESLEALLKLSDVVSLHLEDKPENDGFIGKKEIDLMKNDAVLLNLSTGKAVDLGAVEEALKAKKLKGFAADVFPEEPTGTNSKFNLDLSSQNNVILTPHIGSSTVEAQSNIARFVPDKLIHYMNTGNTFGSANFPNLRLPPLEDAHRLIHIHENNPGMIASINEIFSHRGVNIVGQHLGTNNRIGYVITDIYKVYNKRILKELKKLEGTIKTRVLY